MEDIRKKADLLRQRSPDQIGRIEKRKYISSDIVHYVAGRSFVLSGGSRAA